MDIDQSQREAPVAGADSLLLREPAAADAPALFALINTNRSRLALWLPWVEATRAEADTLAFIAHSRARRAGGSAATWLIEQSGELIGVIDLHDINPVTRSAAVGYWLGRASEGRGWMHLALEQVVRQAWGAMGLLILHIDTDPRNVRSQHVALAAGFLSDPIRSRAVESVSYTLHHPDWTQQDVFLQS